jgi:hypothetical protein
MEIKDLLTMDIKDLAGLSEPLKRLIEVTADGVGALCKPYLIKKTANAKADEMRIMAQAHVDRQKILNSAGYETNDFPILLSYEESNNLLSLPERAEARKIYQESKKQQNIEAICANAAEELESESEVPENKPAPDWINHFFDMAEKVSSEDLQFWWGRILAGEIKKPGSFSLRTLEILKNLSRKEAETFVKLSNYIIEDGSGQAFFFEELGEITDKSILSIPEIIELFEAGLIVSITSSSFSLSLHNDQLLVYASYILLFEIENNARTNSNPVIFLTKSAYEILKLITIEPDMEYVKLIAQKFNRFKQDEIKMSMSPIISRDGNAFESGEKTYIN